MTDVIIIARDVSRQARERRSFRLLHNAARLTRTRIGLGLVTLVAVVAIAGPWCAPHSPNVFVAAPYAAPSAGLPFGADYLGRDVLSRFLWGGRSILVMSVLATVIGVASGILVGLAAAYARGRTEEVLMRVMDVLLAFPQIVLVLLLVAGFGPQLWLLVLTVAFGHLPRVARVARSAAADVVERDFVRAAEVLGEGHVHILLAEILPSISSSMLVEFGLRLTYSIGLIAGVSFLGFGLQPPAADWGLMINENRIGLVLQPWPVVLPVAAIALLTIGMNLITDGLGRSAIGLGRTP